MNGLEVFLDSYGLAAACVLMLVKAAGMPIPIPGDVILLATAARAAEGKVLLWVAFFGLLVAITLGGCLQFTLARGPARQLVMRYGQRLGLTPERLDAVANKVRRSGPLGIGLGVLTTGMRSVVDLSLHFAIGFAGSSLLSASPLTVAVVIAAVGLVVTLYIARRRRAS